ncbi:MAG: TaqI-like C-terminal specificity domain-containing protein [Chloroflexota bacterium]|nr:TaqI-like C-terminal specificity domain-containing protein [Chloroflexota bacterium]
MTSSLSRHSTETLRVNQVDDVLEWQTDTSIGARFLPASNFSETEWIFATVGSDSLIEKLKRLPQQLKDVTTRIFQGLKTSSDDIYIVRKIAQDENKTLVLSQATKREHWVETQLLHPLIKGGNSQAYFLADATRLILFPYKPGANGKMQLITSETLAADFPLAWEYLQQNKETLEKRENGAFKGKHWYAYGRSQALDVIGLPKIFTPDIAPQSSFSLDEMGTNYFTGGTAGGYGLLPAPGVSDRYLLGVLNSSLLEWVVQQTATSMRGGWYSYEARFIRQLPIRTINFDDPADKARHDRMVALVEAMLRLKREHAAESQVFSDKRHEIAQEIERTDAQIDALVYELYGLTDAEIALVEGRGA